MSNQLLIKLGEKLNIDPNELEAVLKKTVFPSGKPVSNEQFAMFLSVANEYNLNPLTKEIYAFPAKGGGIQPIVSIDGWMKIINSHPQFNGMEFEDTLHEAKLVSVKCRIYRKDRDKPQEVVEYLSECDRKNDVWRSWPSRMLRHKAAIQCARYAFNLSGIIDDDEAERYKDARVIDVTNSSDSAANKVLEKLGNKEKSNLLENINNAIAVANDMASLNIAAEMASELKNEDQKQQARNLYKKKLEEIKEGELS